MTKTLDLSVFPDATWDEWRARVEADLSFATLDGLPIQPLYGPSEPLRSGFPGQPPFTRGGQPKTSWGMVQEYANPELEATLQEIQEDLRREAAGVWLCFEGRHPSPRPALPLNGLPLNGLERILALLDLRRQDLKRHSIFLDAGSGCHAAASALFEGASRLGIPSEQLTGCLGCDPLADVARGASFSAEDLFKDLVDLAKKCGEKAPGLRAALISTSVYHDAGASPVQELAFAVASGAEVLRRLTDGGLSLETACRQILFAFSVTGDLFPEIAKLRAARQLWWRVVSACGGSENAGRMVLHGRTSHRTSTLRDRGVNALRGTVETFAAALGGADTVTTAPFDEAYGIAGGFGRKVAANTQLILREESFLDRVTDPAGGSWFVEEHTEQLAAAAWALFQEIEAEGGFATAARSGAIRRRVEEVAAKRSHRLATREAPITGVSEYPNLREEPYQSAPSAAPVDSTPECAEAAWPEAVLTPRRDSEAFEALWRLSEDHLKATGHRPKVFLANLGPLRGHRIRAGFARNLLAAGGVEAISNEGFTDASACGDAFVASGAEVAVVCGSDEAYFELAPAVVSELRGRNARQILLAGRPGEAEKLYRDAGVDDFLFQGCDVIAALNKLLQVLGAAP